MYLSTEAASRLSPVISHYPVAGTLLPATITLALVSYYNTTQLSPASTLALL